MLSKARGTLRWKLAAIGALQLVLLSAAFLFVGMLINGPHHPGPPPGMGMPPPPPPASMEEAPPPFVPHDLDRPGPPGPDPHFAGPLGHAHIHVSPLETLFGAGLIVLGAGSLLTARSIVRPLAQLSRVVEAFGAGDLRARSRLDRNDEIGELAEAFDGMAVRIERLLVAEKELLANVSHELRTPLARIRVALDIVGESEGASRLPLTEIGADLAELETLIDDVFVTTRLEIARGSSSATQLPLHRRRTEAGQLWEQSIERFQARHPERPLQVDVPTSLPAVEVDPMLFRRVLDNLLENAHKYTPEPSVALALRGSCAGKHVVFEVEDHGLGIAKADLPEVFTPFFRGDRSRTRGTGGVGLGLTLAKRIVEAHGGTLTLRSEEGVGTTVAVSLPAAEDVAPISKGEA